MHAKKSSKFKRCDVVNKDIHKKSNQRDVAERASFASTIGVVGGKFGRRCSG